MVENRVKALIQLARNLYHKRFRYPVISYFNKTTLGGYTRGKHFVFFNSLLLENNIEEYYNNIIPHEVAHLICDCLYKGVKAHGKEWRSICLALGGNGKTCHDMDTSVCNEQKRNYWVCHCANCDRYTVIGTKTRLKRIEKEGYICTYCHTDKFISTHYIGKMTRSNLCNLLE